MKTIDDLIGEECRKIEYVWVEEEREYDDEKDVPIIQINVGYRDTDWDEQDAYLENTVENIEIIKNAVIEEYNADLITSTNVHNTALLGCAKLMSKVIVAKKENNEK